MSWIFSKALMEKYENSRCSQEQEAESLGESCSDGEQFAQLNVKPTQRKFWRNDKTMEFSSLSRFGLTCQLLTEDLGEDVLTWYREDSLARTSAQQGKELELWEIEADCGKNNSELPMRFDLISCSWKTQACLFPEVLHWSSVTLPQSGMMLSGQLYELPRSELNMYDLDYGYLPTPTAHNAKEGAYPSEYNRHTPTLATHAGGKINPEWTEWLMGWPTGWTDLEPLGMDKYQEWRQKHSLD